MKKPNLNLSYHEQDGMLLPNIQISNRAEDDRPAGAIWKDGALLSARESLGLLYGIKNELDHSWKQCIRFSGRPQNR